MWSKFFYFNSFILDITECRAFLDAIWLLLELAHFHYNKVWKVWHAYEFMDFVLQTFFSGMFMYYCMFCQVKY